jgi:hypothetical protein
MDVLMYFKQRLLLLTGFLLLGARCTRADLILDPPVNLYAEGYSKIGNDQKSDVHAAQGGGTHTVSASASLSDARGLASAGTTHTTTVPDLIGPTMEGSGEGDIEVEAFDRSEFIASALAIVLFPFHVDASGFFRFTGFVEVEHRLGSTANEVEVALYDDQTHSFLARADIMDTGRLDVDKTVQLTPGRGYRVFAVLDLRSEFEKSPGLHVETVASWGFSLSPTTQSVPEPSSLVLITCGLLACAGSRLYRRTAG